MVMLNVYSLLNLDNEISNFMHRRAKSNTLARNSAAIEALSEVIREAKAKSKVPTKNHNVERAESFSATVDTGREKLLSTFRLWALTKQKDDPERKELCKASLQTMFDNSKTKKDDIYKLFVDDEELKTLKMIKLMQIKDSGGYSSAGNRAINVIGKPEQKQSRMAYSIERRKELLEVAKKLRIENEQKIKNKDHKEPPPVRIPPDVKFSSNKKEFQKEQFDIHQQEIKYYYGIEPSVGPQPPEEWRGYFEKEFIELIESKYHDKQILNILNQNQPLFDMNLPMYTVDDRTIKLIRRKIDVIYYRFLHSPSFQRLIKMKDESPMLRKDYKYVFRDALAKDNFQNILEESFPNKNEADDQIIEQNPNSEMVFKKMPRHLGYPGQDTIPLEIRLIPGRSAPPLKSFDFVSNRWQLVNKDYRAGVLPSSNNLVRPDCILNSENNILTRPIKSLFLEANALVDYEEEKSNNQLNRRRNRSEFLGKIKKEVRKKIEKEDLLSEDGENSEDEEIIVVEDLNRDGDAEEGVIGNNLKNRRKNLDKLQKEYMRQTNYRVNNKYTSKEIIKARKCMNSVQERLKIAVDEVGLLGISDYFSRNFYKESQKDTPDLDRFRINNNLKQRKVNCPNTFKPEQIQKTMDKISISKLAKGPEVIKKSRKFMKDLLKKQSALSESRHTRKTQSFTYLKQQAHRSALISPEVSYTKDFEGRFIEDNQQVFSGITSGRLGPAMAEMVCNRLDKVASDCLQSQCDIVRADINKGRYKLKRDQAELSVKFRRTQALLQVNMLDGTNDSQRFQAMFKRIKNLENKIKKKNDSFEPSLSLFTNV